MIKVYTILNWCEIFGISMEDNDGFKNINLNKNLVTLDSFLEGICECTVCITNKERYKVLDSLL